MEINEPSDTSFDVSNNEMDKASSVKQSPVQIIVDLSIISDSFSVGGRKQPKRISVPVGCVYVLTHDNEIYDQDGYPEVYLSGETVLCNQLSKKSICQVVSLVEFPGTVRCYVRQWLAGISVNKEDAANVSFLMPLRLSDPIEVLKHAGGQLSSPEERQTIDKKYKHQIIQLVNQVLRDKIQLWSSDTRDLSANIFSTLDNDIKRMGLRLDTNIALRKYPKNLYEIVLQFGVAERMILDLTEDEIVDFLDETELHYEDLLKIRPAIGYKDSAFGAGLFQLTRQGSDTMRKKLAGWLEKNRAFSAASFVVDLYLGNHSQQDISLSEQVLLSAFHNPVLGIGEYKYSEQDLSFIAHFQRLNMKFEAALS